jgi:phage portal protein BeeE
MNLVQRGIAALFNIKASRETLTEQPVQRYVQGAGLPSFRLVNGQVHLYDFQTSKLITEGFTKNIDLYSVIMWILRKSKRVPFYPYEVKDEKALGAYKMLTGDGATVDSLREARLVKHKALQVTDQPRLQAIIDNPNPFQSGIKFREEAIAYELLSGKRFIQVIGAVSNPVMEIKVLPSTLMQAIPGPAYGEVAGFKFTLTQQEYGRKEIVYSHNFKPAVEGSIGAEIDGLSPLQVMAMSIQQGNEGRLNSIKQAQNGGPPGILTLKQEASPVHVEYTTDQLASIEDNVNSYGKSKIHVTDLNFNWVQLGLSPVDLDLLKGIAFTRTDFCNGYGLDELIFGSSDSTYANRNEAKKASIVDGVVPPIISLQDDYNTIIEPFNVKGKKYFIAADVTDFPELQEDMNALVDRLSKAWWVTPNQKLAAMQYEENTSNPLMNEPWVPSGFTPISEYERTDAPDDGDDDTYANE